MQDLVGKKYFETKRDSLESSILGVWQDAAVEEELRHDARTKQYKEHRAKLEAARQRRESKKINEEVDLDEAILKGRDYEYDEKKGVVKISKKNFLS